MDRRLPLLLAGLVAVARADDTAATMYVSSETTGQCASVEANKKALANLTMHRCEAMGLL